MDWEDDDLPEYTVHVGRDPESEAWRMRIDEVGHEEELTVAPNAIAAIRARAHELVERASGMEPDGYRVVLVTVTRPGDLA